MKKVKKNMEVQFRFIAYIFSFSLVPTIPTRLEKVPRYLES